MILSLTIDPFLPKIVIISIIIIMSGFLLRIIRQPYVIAYIITGIFLGPYGIGVITDKALISNIGGMGIILLLFFVGMEIKLPNLLASWRVSVLGTLLQISASVIFVWCLGKVLDWPLNQIILFGFVISLSSTALIIKYLQDKKEMETKVGKNVIGVLLAQDIIVIPMLLCINYLSGKHPGFIEISKQISGAVFILAIILFVIRKKKIHVPFEKYIIVDHELQVFIAFALCFGFSIVTAYLGLTTALGAFAAGTLISAARSTEWVYKSLHSFQILFVALFFFSIGMIIDIDFLSENLWTVFTLLSLIYIGNQIINTLAMRAFGGGWRESLYFGALLSQIGEFSFVIGFAGYESGIISEFNYQLLVSVIGISLLASPVWISGVNYLLFPEKKN